MRKRWIFVPRCMTVPGQSGCMEARAPPWRGRTAAPAAPRQHEGAPQPQRPPVFTGASRPLTHRGKWLGGGLMRFLEMKDNQDKYAMRIACVCRCVFLTVHSREGCAMLGAAAFFCWIGRQYRFLMQRNLRWKHTSSLCWRIWENASICLLVWPTGCFIFGHGGNTRRQIGLFVKLFFCGVDCFQNCVKSRIALCNIEYMYLIIKKIKMKFRFKNIIHSSHCRSSPGASKIIHPTTPLTRPASNRHMINSRHREIETAIEPSETIHSNKCNGNGNKYVTWLWWVGKVSCTWEPDSKFCFEKKFVRF